MAKDDEFFASHDPSKQTVGQRICYIFNGLLVSALPVYLFVEVLGLELTVDFSLPLVAIVSLVATFAIAHSYHNVARNVNQKLHRRRQEAVAAEVERNAGAKKGDKNALRKLTEEKTAAVVQHESVALSIFFNNAFFLFLAVLSAFWVFHAQAAHVNYVLSVGAASGLVALLSTSS